MIFGYVRSPLQTRVKKWQHINPVWVPLELNFPLTYFQPHIFSIERFYPYTQNFLLLFNGYILKKLTITISILSKNGAQAIPYKTLRKTDRLDWHRESGLWSPLSSISIIILDTCLYATCELQVESLCVAWYFVTLLLKDFWVGLYLACHLRHFGHFIYLLPLGFKLPTGHWTHEKSSTLGFGQTCYPLI